jgi:hypothetical protein
MQVAAAKSASQITSGWGIAVSGGGDELVLDNVVPINDMPTRKKEYQWSG